MNTGGACEIINRIADEVNDAVKELGKGQECETCKGTFTDYDGSCQGYSSLLYFGKNGYWEFSLYLHTKEIWSTGVTEGSICDILLKALKGLANGEWKK